MTERITTDLLNRISKIKALADAAGTAGEAEAAAGMLSRLLLKHNLDLADIDDLVQRENRPVTHSDFDIGTDSAWKQSLMFGIANANMCRALAFEGKPTMTLIGHAHNLIVVKELYLWLADEVQRIAFRDLHEAQQWDEPRPEYDYEHPDAGIIDFYNRLGDWDTRRTSHYVALDDPATWLRSYRQGLVYGVNRKMADAKQTLKEEEGERWAIVPLLEKEVDDYLDKNFQYRREDKSDADDKLVSSLGIDRGYSISVDPQVRGTAEHKQLGG